MKKYEIGISSPPDREKLVAEISFDNIQWAEINQEREVLEVEFYSRPDGEPWRIDYQDAVKALDEAKRKLVGN
jgi:hypothetical protein